MNGEAAAEDAADARRIPAELSIVVVTHNSASVLPPLIDAINDVTKQTRVQAVVVDNGSGDSTVSLIRDRLPEALVIANRENLGFARAVNQGFAATSSTYVLLMNPDTRFEARQLFQLMWFLDAHENAAAVAPRLVYADGAPQFSARRFPTHVNVLFSRGSPLRLLAGLLPKSWRYTLPDPSAPTRVESIAATFVLIRRDAFMAVGGMDEGYFLYVEDTDLCYRWHQRGYEVWMEPSVAVIHDWRGGSAQARRLRRYHRDGIRRYFRAHHARKRVRNAIVNGLLTLADRWDAFGPRE